MTTIVRSVRPTCPACGFAVFNRRCATCEKCHAELPTSVVYTAEELAILRRDERVADDRRAARAAGSQATPARRGAHSPLARLVGDRPASDRVTPVDVVDFIADLTDLLGD